MFSIIAAVAENRVIGNQGRLPWHLSEDLKRFKQLTMNHPIIMGRKTHGSIGKPLPGRRNIVVSRQTTYVANGCEVVGSLADARQRVADSEEAFCIGGAAIYRQALPFADRMYLTRVLAEVPGDTRFPEWDQLDWKIVQSEPGPSDLFEYLFEIWERRV